MQSLIAEKESLLTQFLPLDICFIICFVMVTLPRNIDKISIYKSIGTRLQKIGQFHALKFLFFLTSFYSSRFHAVNTITKLHIGPTEDHKSCIHVCAFLENACIEIIRQYLGQIPIKYIVH